jgi:lycopene cyclase domain-containing protein
MITLSYLEFHLLFLGPPLLLLAAATVRVAAARRAADGGAPWTRIRLGERSVDARVLGVVIMAVLALGYTTPWDSYLIRQGVWGYGGGTVLVRAFAVPLGEYLFFVVQPILTALWLYLLVDPPGGPLGVGPGLGIGRRALGVAGGGLVALVGWIALGSDGGLYLGTLLLWSAPVLALQWGFGWPYLWRRRRTVALGVAVPTLYLWLADRVALALGVWRLSPAHTTGLTVPVLSLPIEEAAFFLLTNLFLVQGLVLWLWVADRWL